MGGESSELGVGGEWSELGVRGELSEIGVGSELSELGEGDELSIAVHKQLLPICPQSSYNFTVSSLGFYIVRGR